MGVQPGGVVLATTARVLKRFSFPGQTLIADTLTRVLAPASGELTGAIGSYSVTFDVRDTVQRHIYFGLYDRPLSRLLPRLLREGSVFYDVGANIGYFSLLAAQLVGKTGEVHAFEPVPSNATRIRAAAAANQIENLRVNDVAVTDQVSTLTLFVPDSVTNSGWASVVPSERRPQELTVSTISIDEYVWGSHVNGAVRRPDVIKLDIEGSEPMALRGMERVLTASDGPDVVVEVNPFLLNRANSTPSDIVSPLRSRGYELFAMLDKRLQPLDDNATFDHLTDVYATKRGMPARR